MFFNANFIVYLASDRCTVKRTVLRIIYGVLVLIADTLEDVFWPRRRSTVRPPDNGQGESAGSTKSVPSRYRVSAEAPAESISAVASRRALPERTLEHTAPRVASSRAELLAPLATFYRELCIYMIY